MFGLYGISLSFVRLHKPFRYTLSTDDFFAVNKIRARFSRFSAFFLIFCSFLGFQTPSKDDNLEDERLKPLPP